MADITHIPSEFILPIVGQNEDESCGPFLGTGVFVGEAPYLVTCNHVLDQWDKEYAIAIEQEDRLAIATVLNRDADTDLAILNIDGYNPPHSLPFEEDKNIMPNDIVMCFEYGTTITAGYNIEFSPANRIGNVTRFRNLPDLFGKAGDHMLELSFPALKGASGAPIMSWKQPFKLWGIVTANWSTELMPAQVETIHDGKGNIEEDTKYYLPQALAIHVKHVRELITKLTPNKASQTHV